MLRSVLVVLDGSRSGKAAAALAMDWASRLGARLVGRGVLDEPSIRGGEPVPLGAGAYKRERDDARLVEAHGHVLEVLEDFRARSAAAGVTAEVIEGVGDSVDRILRETPRSDVIILGRETHFHFVTQDRPDTTLAQVLRNSPRPVVTVPRDLSDGRGIVVAYGGGREVVRTLQTFQRLGLAAGEEIQVVTVHRDEAQAQALAHLAGQYLSAHEALHKLRPVASAAPPSEVLLDAVHQGRPRLLERGPMGIIPCAISSPPRLRVP